MVRSKPLQLLLEQMRKPPAFTGWGLFTVEKATSLSLLAFVLTYLVIMMQMVQVGNQVNVQV